MHSSGAIQMQIHCLQVALLPSAVSADGAGQAACVTAANGNKARIKNGIGVFKDVHLRSEQPGQYTLKAKPSSREVPILVAVHIP